MKKLLLILLLPLSVLAQDLKVGINYGADANVGEEIELKLELFSIDNQSVNSTFLMFDVNWNNKLIQYVSHTIDPYNKIPNAQTNRSHWDGYIFNVDESFDVSDLTGQYNNWRNGTNSYSGNPDWSVNRYTVQNSEDINLVDAIVTIKFKILDRQGSNYADYSDIFKISWAFLRDDRTGDEYSVTSTNQSISLNPGGVGAGDVVLTLDVPHDNKQDYGYSIYKFSQLEAFDWDEDGNIDGYGPKPNETPFANGNFDSSGIATIAGLTIDEYSWVHTHIVYDGQSHPEWLDDVVTVTDVYKIFQYSLDTDINGGGGSWEYKIQGILGEVTNDGFVDFQDSYELLAHINGVTTSANVTSTENGDFSLSALKDVYGLLDGSDWHLFTPTDSNKAFTIAHGLRGDVDFSHSTTPTAEGSEVEQQSNTFSKMSIISNHKVENQNLDISSRLEDGKVIMEIDIATEGLVGTQFNINYDDSILTLDNIIFDTGNEMTNFANHKVEQAKINIGSLDQNGDITIKTGIAYKLIFSPITEIQNTSGLITFKITEGVKADGTKIKFNIE